MKMIKGDYMYDITFISYNGIWYKYKINGLIIEFNYKPTHDDIIRIYNEYIEGDN